MFFIFSKILDFTISPLVWCIVLFLLALISKNQARKRKYFIAGFSMLILFTNPFIVNKVLGSWEIKPYSSNKINRGYDVAIVLGGESRYYNTETGRLVYGNGIDRLLQAVALYRQKKVKKILLSGGSGYLLMQNIKESVLLKQVLLDMNIPDSDVIIETQSRNTYENALMSAAILKSNLYGKRYLIITSAFHMRRTIACFNKQGITGDAFPVDEHSSESIFTPEGIFIPDAGVLSAWDMLFHEWVGIGIYKISGYI
jgi:uncharacterized SAM-binding protein YcdF (DUF218 family)